MKESLYTSRNAGAQSEQPEAHRQGYLKKESGWQNSDSLMVAALIHMKNADLFEVIIVDAETRQAQIPSCRFLS